MIPSIFTPTERDWAADALLDPDNGAYGHTCHECNLPFVGHKRRVDICRVCADQMQTETARRDVLVTQAGLDPAEWVLVPRVECDKQLERLIGLLLDLGDERALRRKLAAALKVADQTNSNVAYLGHPNRHRDTSEALLVESAKMDEVKT